MGPWWASPSLINPLPADFHFAMRPLDAILKKSRVVRQKNIEASPSAAEHATSPLPAPVAPPPWRTVPSAAFRSHTHILSLPIPLGYGAGLTPRGPGAPRARTPRDPDGASPPSPGPASPVTAGSLARISG